MNMPESKSVGFVILPDEETAKIAREVYGQIANQHETVYNLEMCQPHITLYQAKFGQDGLKKATEKFKKLVQKVSSMRVKLTNIAPFLNSYVFWDCEPNPGLQALHEEVVQVLSEFRYTSDSISPQNLNLTKSMQENIERYGCILAMKDYRPHLTITRLKKNVAVEVVGKLPQQKSEFQLDAYAVCILGPNGESLKVEEKITL